MGDGSTDGHHPEYAHGNVPEYAQRSGLFCAPLDLNRESNLLDSRTLFGANKICDFGGIVVAGRFRVPSYYHIIRYLPPPYSILYHLPLTIYYSYMIIDKKTPPPPAAAARRRPQEILPLLHGEWEYPSTDTLSSS